MKNTKMYLTQAEADAKGLPSVQEQIERHNVAVKTSRLVADITSKYTAKEWATVAIYGADLTADQIAKAEWDNPFVHRDAVRDAIMRESGKHVTSYDAAQAILKGGD